MNRYWTSNINLPKQILPKGVKVGASYEMIDICQKIFTRNYLRSFSKITRDSVVIVLVSIFLRFDISISTDVPVF